MDLVYKHLTYLRSLMDLVYKHLTYLRSLMDLVNKTPNISSVPY